MNDENDSMENSKLYQELSELFNRAEPSPSSNVHHPPSPSTNVHLPSSIEFETPPTTSEGGPLDIDEMTPNDSIKPRTILDLLKEEEQYVAHNTEDAYNQSENPTEFDVSPLRKSIYRTDVVEPALMLLQELKYSEDNSKLILIIDSTTAAAQSTMKFAFSLLVLRVFLYNTVKYVNITTLWAMLYLLSTLMSEEYRTYFSIVSRIDGYLTERADHHAAYAYPTVDTIIPDRQGI